MSAMLERLEEMTAEAEELDAVTADEWLKDADSKEKYYAHLHASDLLTYLERAAESYQRMTAWQG